MYNYESISETMLLSTFVELRKVYVKSPEFNYVKQLVNQGKLRCVQITENNNGMYWYVERVAE